MTKNEFVNECLLKMNTGALDLLSIKIADVFLSKGLIIPDDYRQVVSHLSRILDYELPNAEEVEDLIIDEIVNKYVTEGK